MQVFYAFAAIYLFIGLVLARRATAHAARPGWRGQIGVLCAVLGAGLLWPERLGSRGPFD
ncbi:MAG: hypothetical protein JO021_17485 [Alphaproteobacteria bacterium]|nr:hypothetical protein [Alphaproteobacteria bacterium]